MRDMARVDDLWDFLVQNLRPVIGHGSRGYLEAIDWLLDGADTG